jgi:hypothetical protein
MCIYIYMMDGNNIIGMIGLLPEDVVLYEILPSISSEVIAGLNRQNYTDFHSCLKNRIPGMRYESYIRRTARNDHSFVFEQILGENFDKWRSMKKYLYNSCIFETYLHFLIQFCIDNDSPKCRELIDRKASSVLNEKWHKHSRIRRSRSSRWSS